MTENNVCLLILTFMRTLYPYQLAVFGFLIAFVSNTNAQVVICGDTTNENYISFDDTILISNYTYDSKYDLTGDFIPDLYFDVESYSVGIVPSTTVNINFSVYVDNPNIELMMNLEDDPYNESIFINGFKEGETVNYETDTTIWNQRSFCYLLSIYYGYGGIGGGGDWAYYTERYMGFRLLGDSDTTYGWFKLGRDFYHSKLYVLAYSGLDGFDFNIIPWAFEKDNGIKFFPNPANNQIMPVVPFSGHVYLFDYNGVLKYESTYKQNELIPLPSYINDGLYLIKFIGDNKETQSDYLIIDGDN